MDAVARPGFPPCRIFLARAFAEFSCSRVLHLGDMTLNCPAFQCSTGPVDVKRVPEFRQELF